MRITQLILFFSVTGINLFAGYREGDFAISQIKSASNKYFQIPNDIITNGTDDSLSMVDSIPVLRPGQLIMRKKVDKEYALFKGVLDTTVFSKRPILYTFEIPGWARINDIIQYRFYREPTEKIGSDEETVYFDNERIYIRNFPLLYYFKNGIWFKLEGADSLTTGSVNIKSEPAGAQIILNGENTHLITPCSIHRLLPGMHTLELFLDKYHFFHKSVRIYPDSITMASFQLMSDMDTVFITGNAAYGLLVLPQPPIDTLFSIDSSFVDEPGVRLSPGVHRLQWHGGIFYESIDTTIVIRQGIVNYFDNIFRRRFGTVRIIPLPADAEVCIDNNPCRFGEQIMKIPSGNYRISAHRYGFKSMIKEIVIYPDTMINFEMNLLKSPDSDGDGFVDSIDKCPNLYGIHDGCPRQRFKDALSIKWDDIVDYVKNDPVSFDISTVGFIVRIPTRKRFTDFLSIFSSGQIGAINNYRGLTFLNQYQFSFKSLFGAVELGQWASGIRYRRGDTLTIRGGNGQSYSIFYDTLADVEPILILPSTSVSVGLHYNLSRINVAYSLGYQWEDIIIDDIYNNATGQIETITFNNDWWYHQLTMEANFRPNKPIAPVAYFKFKFPFGTTRRTRWHMIQTGLQLKFKPSLKRGT